MPITARLADRYNNPAPDGTAVAWTTDGGHIVGNCTTPAKVPGDGTCTVTWTSANPRPTVAGTVDNPPIKGSGRTVILATAIGEESFTDVNGNGFWDPGEPFVAIGEPYRDDNENGQYDVDEYFLDYNQNGVHDGPTASFVGITCNGTTASSTCTTATLAIGAQLLMVMSTSGAVVSLVSPAAPVSFPHGGSGGTITFNVQDGNGNPVAANTTIAISADSGAGTINSLTSSYTTGCSVQQGGQNFQTILTTAATAGSGNVYVQVTSPASGTKTLYVIPVTIT